jgi:methyl coenzyme M reductase subunit D
LISDPELDTIRYPNQEIDFDVTKGMVTMPYLKARWEIFYVGHMYQQIFPFTPNQLVNGYAHGKINFNAYADYNAYLNTFQQALTGLVDEHLYDPAIAAKF